MDPLAKNASPRSVTVLKAPTKSHSQLSSYAIYQLPKKPRFSQASFQHSGKSSNPLVVDDVIFQLNNTPTRVGDMPSPALNNRRSDLAEVGGRKPFLVRMENALIPPP